MSSIGGLFSSCSCCNQRCCVGRDWTVIGHICANIENPLLTTVEVCLQAPCGEEGRVFKKEAAWKDIATLENNLRFVVMKNNELWKEGSTFTIETDLGVAQVCKDSIKNKS